MYRINIRDPDTAYAFKNEPCCDGAHLHDSYDEYQIQQDGRELSYTPSSHRTNCKVPKAILLYKDTAAFAIIHDNLNIKQGFIISPPTEMSKELLRREEVRRVHAERAKVLAAQTRAGIREPTVIEAEMGKSPSSLLRKDPYTETSDHFLKVAISESMRLESAQASDGSDGGESRAIAENSPVSTISAPRSAPSGSVSGGMLHAPSNTNVSRQMMPGSFPDTQDMSVSSNQIARFCEMVGDQAQAMRAEELAKEKKAQIAVRATRVKDAAEEGWVLIDDD